MFVRFTNNRKENYAAMKRFFARLKAYKENPTHKANKLGQAEFWDLSPASQRHFYVWDTGALTDAQAAVKLDEPRFDDERWNVTALLKALKEGDYQLDELVTVEKDVIEMRIKDQGENFDGLDDLMELLEAFALPLVGYQEEGSYVQVE